MGHSDGVSRRLWPHRNELMRPADWIEATLLIAAIAAALVLFPVALTVGSDTYARQLALGQEQLRDRHQTTAILLEDGDGNLAGEPITHEEAAMAGLAAGMGLWVVSAAGLCVLYLTGRTVLNRRRVTAWQRDWARVAPKWTHSA